MISKNIPQFIGSIIYIFILLSYINNYFIMSYSFISYRTLELHKILKSIQPSDILLQTDEAPLLFS